MGSSINKDKGYAVKFADIVTLSFHPVKAITTGEGGAILTNHKKFNTKIKLLREHGIERNNYLHWKYKVNELGYNYRLPDINCALGISQLKKLNKFVSKRKKLQKFMTNILKVKNLLFQKKYLILKILIISTFIKFR